MTNRSRAKYCERHLKIVHRQEQLERRRAQRDKAARERAYRILTSRGSNR